MAYVKIHTVEEIKLALIREDDSYLQELLASAWAAGYLKGVFREGTDNPFLEEGLVNRPEDGDEDD